MKIKLPTVTLFYEQKGQGDPIIFLHGNGEDHQIFDALVARFEKFYTTYALDSRNHGQSEQTAIFDYQVMADDVADFCNQLALPYINLVGFSDGAIIALLLALQGKVKINKLVLMGVNLSPQDFTAANYQKLQEAVAKNPNPLLQLMLDQPNIPLAKLKDLMVPTLVVAGEYDIFKSQLFKQIAKTLPHSQLLIMPGQDHESYIKDTDLLYPDLLAFFSQR